MISFPREALLRAGLADSMSPCSLATDSAELRASVLGVYCSLSGITLELLLLLIFGFIDLSLSSLNRLSDLVVSCSSNLFRMSLLYPLMLNAVWVWFMHWRCAAQPDESS